MKIITKVFIGIYLLLLGASLFIGFSTCSSIDDMPCWMQGFILPFFVTEVFIYIFLAAGVVKLGIIILKKLLPKSIITIDASGKKKRTRSSIATHQKAD